MASVNKVILMGNAGKDAEVRTTSNGMSIASVSIATSTRRKDKSTGEMVDETQWHRVLFFDRLAEIAGEYVKKGKPLYVEGRLKYGKYTDKDGVERNTTDIVATEMQLLGGREAPQAEKPAQPAAKPAPSNGFDDMDSDVPFLSFHAGHDPMMGNRKAMRARAAR